LESAAWTPHPALFVALTSQLFKTGVLIFWVSLKFGFGLAETHPVCEREAGMVHPEEKIKFTTWYHDSDSHLTKCAV